jgi:Asp-tRNA(Asn)/Glu-tRNA(Gln) amidotransferase A subunit family amidase
VAIGADGGGSIRIPAAMNGVVGFKPTYARVSEHGALPLCTSVGHIGPLAASVEDAALVYAAMAGTDRLDPMTEDQPPVSLEGLGESNIAGLRVGVDRAWLAHSNGEVKKATEAVLQRLQGRGAVLVDVSVPDLEASRVAHIVTILWEMDKFSATHAPDVAAYGAAVQVSLAVGSSFTQAEYDWAQRVRRRAMENFMGVFDKVDVMVTPTSAVTAPHLGKFDPAVGYADVTSTVQTMRYAFAANLTGLPAISIPAGYDAHGLPIGVQVMGPAWSENRLLMVGGVIEADAPTQKRPKMFFDLLEKPYF